MGRLGSVHGIRGYLKLVSYTEQPESLFDYSPWFVRESGGQWREVKVADHRPMGQGFLVLLEGVGAREEALPYAGLDIGIRRSSLPPAPEGQVYLQDLVGLRVEGLDGVSLGTVLRVVDHGAAPIMEVSPSGHGKDVQLIPFVRGPIVTAVDLDAGVVRTVWGADY